MRKLNLANSKNRSTELGIYAKPSIKKVRQKLEDGGEKYNISYIKSTIETDIDYLEKKYGENLSQKLIEEDIEVDYEKIGLKLNNLNRVYIDKDDKLVFQIQMLELKKNPSGEEIDRKKYERKESNVNLEKLPLKWSSKFMKKELAIKKFVFSRHYQIFHTDSLSFDFLYDMAKELDEKNSLVFVGSGKKGNMPIIMSSGGSPYRGFLEGRIKDDKYLLILHLTNLELKELIKEEEE